MTKFSGSQRALTAGSGVVFHMRVINTTGSYFLRRGMVALLAALSFTLPAYADMEVPAGTFSNTGGGTFDLACSDLLVGGTLDVDSGQIINVRHVVITAGGVINGNAGLIALSGNWSNSGSFVGGTSTVSFGDNPACATSSTLSGNTAFANVSFISTLGKTYTFTAGTTQSVSGLLTIQGTPALAIVFLSSAPGQYAFINLLGSQQIRDVAVDWVAATGIWQAAGQSNRNPNGNAPRWFGNGEVIPTLDPRALALLTLLILAGGLWRRRQRAA